MMEKRILLVDDDVELCRLIERSARWAGFVLEAVHSGREGCTLAQREDYVLIILDVMLPEMDGFEVLAASMPCVVTVTKPYFDPRFPTIKSKLAAGRAQIPTLTADDLPVDRESIGLKGSPTKVKKSFTPPQKQGGIKISEDSSEASARKLFAMLSDANIIG